MRAIIRELWNTGMEIITTEADANEINSFSSLRKCDNVIVGDKLAGTPATEVLIDDLLCYVYFREVKHPQGGWIRICQI
jgi:hypothetical protein